MPSQFPFAYPLFTTKKLKQTSNRESSISGGVYYTDSIYYVWFQYLRASEKYKVVCAKKGKVKNKAQRDVFTKFGNVNTTDFKKFWSKKGADLFGFESEQVSEFTVGEQMSMNYVYLKVPFQQKAKSINKQIATLLTKKRKAFQLKRGRTKRQFMQTAQFVPTTDKVQYLKFALQVYELKRKHPKLKLWQLSQKMYDAYGSKFSKLHLTKQQQAEKYAKADIINGMSTHANRMRKTAKAKLDSVAIGKF